MRKSKKELEFFSKISNMFEDLRALDYGSKDSQLLRFRTIGKLTQFSGRSLLDIGCGYGDLLKYLISINNSPMLYTGIEICPEIFDRLSFQMAEIIRAGIFDQDSLKIESADYFTNSKYRDQNFDIVLALGSLNYDKEAVLERIQFMWSRCNHEMIFTLPSDLTDINIRANAEYVNPVFILEECLKLSRFTMLDHYLPHEFIVRVKR